MERPVDAPPRVWSSAKESAEWLGITYKEFLADLRRYPHHLPGRAFGRRQKYHWMTLVAFTWYRSAGSLPPAVGGEE